MSKRGDSYTVRIHQEDGHGLWAEVIELPGLFASGDDMDELKEALEEAVGLYLSPHGRCVYVELQPAPETVTTRQILVTC
jgi:predicted RNase H-like HicB family nuclease